MNPTFNLRVGLQQMQLADYFLLNERAIGIDMSKSVNGFNLKLNAGIVTKNFARNGVFCSTCYLYDIVPSRTFPLGSSWGETNFAALSFSKNVSKKSSSTSTASSSSNEGFDEFESFDEFDSFEEVGTSSNKRFLQSYGAVLYSDFGTLYTQNQLYGGLYTLFL